MQKLLKYTKKLFRRLEYVDRIAERVPGLDDREYYVTFWINTVKSMESAIVSSRLPLYSKQFYIGITETVINQLSEHIALLPGDITIMNIMPIKEVWHKL